jgi:uncharacterized protein involved in exopolysaccharide biosynthesis
MPSQEYNLVHVLNILNKWKKNIAIFVASATIATALFSWFFLDDYYLSYARFYPVNLAYTDRSYMFSETGVNITFYGDKDDVNRTLTIANSSELAQFVIDKYNLARHYKIDTTKKFWKTKVQKEFESNYKAIKTEEGAVEISIYDTDAQLAKDIMEDYLVKIDEVNRFRNNEAKKTQLALFEKQIAELQQKADTYADTLGVLGAKYKITVRAVAGTQVVEGQDYSGIQIFKVIMEKQKSTLELMNNMTEIQEQIKSSIEANTMSLSILDKPFVADRKDKPKRSIIVITALFLSLFTAIFAALAVEQYKEIRSQLI